jgi:hypothetical protein
MANKETPDGFGATNPGPKPGDFPLGSPQSRAAARAQIEVRENLLAESFLKVFREEQVQREGESGYQRWQRDNIPSMSPYAEFSTQQLEVIRDRILKDAYGHDPELLEAKRQAHKRASQGVVAQ